MRNNTLQTLVNIDNLWTLWTALWPSWLAAGPEKKAVRHLCAWLLTGKLQCHLCDKCIFRPIGMQVGMAQFNPSIPTICSFCLPGGIWNKHWEHISVNKMIVCKYIPSSSAKENHHTYWAHMLKNLSMAFLANRRILTRLTVPLLVVYLVLWLASGISVTLSVVA